MLERVTVLMFPPLGKLLIGTEHPFMHVDSGDTFTVPQFGDPELSANTAPSLSGFRFQNEMTASPLLYRSLKEEGLIDLDKPLIAPPLWVPGTGQLEVLENRAWLWLEASGSENGVRWHDESIKFDVTFLTDKTTIVEIGADGRFKLPDIKATPKTSEPINPLKPVDPNQPIYQNKGFDPEDSFEPKQPTYQDKGFNPNDSLGPNQPTYADKGFHPNDSLDPTQPTYEDKGFDPNDSLDPNQPTDPDKGFDPDSGFGPNQSTYSDKGFDPDEGPGSDKGFVPIDPDDIDEIAKTTDPVPAGRMVSVGRGAPTRRVVPVNPKRKLVVNGVA